MGVYRIDDPEKIAARLRAKVERDGDCMLWTGARVNGYASISYMGKQHYAHHLTFALAGGQWDSTVRLIGQCPSKACINPDHWKPRDRRWGGTVYRNGTHSDRMLEVWANRTPEEREAIIGPWVEAGRPFWERQREKWAIGWAITQARRAGRHT
jgi:hypothetical protein